MKKANPVIGDEFVTITEKVNNCPDIRVRPDTFDGVNPTAVQIVVLPGLTLLGDNTFGA